MTFRKEVEEQLNVSETDSLDIMEILKEGDIDFSKSNVKNDPCRLYWIEGTGYKKGLIVTVELCDSIATVSTLDGKKQMPTP